MNLLTNEQKAEYKPGIPTVDVHSMVQNCIKMKTRNN